MTVGIIIYFIIIAAILIFDGVWVFVQCKASNSPILECNFIRYIRPIEILLSMFSITMLELVVQFFDLVTAGFVNYTAIFLGVFALVYVVDFIIKEVKLKSYKFIIIKTNKRDFKNALDNIQLKTHYDDSYLRSEDIALVNEKSDTLHISKKTLKNYLITRAVMAAFMLIAMIASAVAVNIGGA